MLKEYKGKKPQISNANFVAETADIIGDVKLDESVNVWYNTVIRGDVNQINIGKRTNVQDLSVIHVDTAYATNIGEDVTIGHQCIIHGCTIDDRVLVGMGSIIMNGALIESDVIIGAGTLIPQNKKIPSKSLVIGSPGKVIRTLTDAELEDIKASASDYVALSNHHK